MKSSATPLTLLFPGLIDKAMDEKKARRIVELDGGRTRGAKKKTTENNKALLVSSTRRRGQREEAGEFVKTEERLVSGARSTAIESSRRSPSRFALPVVSSRV